MTLVWKGDFSTGDAKQYAGGWEYHGSQQPPPVQYVAVGENVNGFAPPPGCKYLAAITVRPGDTYGGSTGWRTLGRQFDPAQGRAAPYESWYVWAQLLPADFPGDADILVAPFEVHQTKAADVAVTGPAPVNTAANHSGNGEFVSVKGGKDGAFTEYIKTTVDTAAPRGVWRVYTCHVALAAAPDGAFGLYLVDQPLVARTGIGVGYEGTTNYPLFGLYRNQVGTSVTRLYLAGVREYSTAAEAFAWARTLAGTNAPPTRPVHDAVGKVSAAANPNIRHALDLIADKVEP